MPDIAEPRPETACPVHSKLKSAFLRSGVGSTSASTAAIVATPFSLISPALGSYYPGMADQGIKPSSANYVLRAFELFERYGDQEAIVWRDQRLSYANLISMTLSLTAGLRDHGVEPGSATALLV